MLSVLSIAIFLAGCGTINKAILAAGKQTGEVEASKTLADYPDDCRKTSRSGVRDGERLDAALLRTDQALSNQNNRTVRCAEWYDELKSNIEERGPNAAD